MSGIDHASTRHPQYQDPSRKAPPRRLPVLQGTVRLGYDNDRFLKENVLDTVGWHPDKVANHHIGMIGLSGSGKTYQLRNMIFSVPPDVEVDIFDWHGDIELPVSADVAEANFNQNTKYGYNPLILNPDPEYGGVRRGVMDLIDAINNTSSKLGAKQEFCLRNLLYDTYARFNIFPDRPETWRRKILSTAQVEQLKRDGNMAAVYASYPTIEDVHAFGMAKLKTMLLGANEDDEGANIATAAIDELSKIMSRLDSANIKIGQLKKLSESDIEEIDKLEAQRYKAMVKAEEAFSKYVRNMRTGREFEEHVKYQSKDTILSVLTRLDNLIATGIFSQNPPPFGMARIRRYFLRPLARSPDELSMFIRFRMRAIIRSMMQEGHVDGRLRRLIVLDEASQFADDSPENPINVIATQMRKFGLGLMLASQSIAHFTDDFVQNAGTVLVLTVAPSDYDNTARKLKVDKSVFGFLQPRRTAVVRLTEVAMPPRIRRLLLTEG